MGKKRLAIAAVVVLLIVGSVAVLWHVLDWPPPRLILKYGFSPAGGPTGRTRTIAGMEFVEMSRGAALVLRDEPREGDFITHRYWAEIDGTLWMSRETVPGEMLLAMGDFWKDWEGTAEAVCAELTDKERGRFRMPTRSEWDYAHVTGAIPRGAHREYMQGPDGEIEEHWPPGFGLFCGTGFPGIRLVWIPPED